ncbi:hypothetical protein MYVA_5288 [Mycolicibacterium vaccae 95051]|nr:hypothetical protein MYVA_5288 [Mycolicibacterium vaccae 95051]
MSQLSFFSAESVPPVVADLTGILAAPGQAVVVGGAGQQAARLSVVVDALWRAEGLAEMIADAGLEAEIARTDEDSPLVRTAVDARLLDIAADWTTGAVKTVPRSGCPDRGSCGRGRWRRAGRRTTAICSGSTRTHPTRILRSRQR